MTVLPQIARPDETYGEGFVFYSGSLCLTCCPVAKIQHWYSTKTVCNPG